MTPCAVLALAIVAAPTGYPPGERNWNCPAGGTFSSPSCWLEGSAPDDDDVAIFDIDATYTVTLSVNPTDRAARALVRRGEVTFDASNGFLGLNGGLLDTPGLVVGEQAGDDAAVHVIGSGSTVGPLFATLGRDPGSSGTLTFTPDDGNPFSSIGYGPQLRVGDGGTGDLQVNVAPGVSSTFVIGLDVIVGRQSTGVGHVHLDGAISWSSMTWTVGEGGSATVTIEDGADVGAARTDLALQPGSTADVQVLGAGTVWDHDESLRVGVHGDALLVIEEGAAVTTNLSTLLGTASGIGELQVRGPGSVLNVGGDLWSGQFGTATLVAAGGGRVLVAGDLIRVTDDSLVVFELGSAGDYPVDPALDVAGLTDDFAAELALVGGYTPAVGDAFLLAEADLSLGTFTFGDLPALPAGLAWNLVQDATTLHAEVVGTSFADVTGDDIVDVNDLMAVIVAWGPCDSCPADVNGDGQVNVMDLVAVVQEWS